MTRKLCCLILSLLLGAFLFTGCVSNNGGGRAGNQQSSASTNWGLYWSDEFNGTNIDTSVWSNEVFSAGHFNSEWEAYNSSPSNSYITNFNGNSVLAIKAIYNGGGISSGNYTSARLISGYHKYFQYGKIEARIQLPYGNGIWPAFWMLGTNCSEVGGSINWPNNGEIDILEIIGGSQGSGKGGGDGTLFGTVHGPASIGGDYNSGSGIGGNTSISGKFSDNFHVFELDWSSNNIGWYLDGTNYFSVNNTTVASIGSYVFNQPFFILLNLAVGGSWPGNPDSSTVFPQYMYVDWIRVYTN